MSINARAVAAFGMLFALIVSGCGSSGDAGSNAASQPAGKIKGATNTSSSGVRPASEGVAPTVGVEKEKPAPGKGNVQGKVLFNEKPVAGVEVRLCEKFSRFGGGAGGKIFTVKTDSAGEYLIKNVPPRVYEGLLVKVFNTPSYVFATSGYVGAAKYKIEEGRTFFAQDTNLFKSDLKLLNPRAGSKIPPADIEVKWAAYPDAAYYKFSVYADTKTGAKPEYDFIGKRVEGLSYVLDKPLSPGSYTCKAEAYNGGDVKLAESSSDIQFRVKGGAAK